MSVENLERFPAAAPVKSEQSGPGTILSGVIISVTRMNSIDAAEHLPAPGTASKGASKNASRFVQAKYKHSLESVHRCYTGVLALAKSGHRGKTVQFRPPPPSPTCSAASSWDFQKSKCQQKCQQNDPRHSNWLELCSYYHRTSLELPNGAVSACSKLLPDWSRS